MHSGQEKLWRTSQQERGAVGSKLALHRQRKAENLGSTDCLTCLLQGCRTESLC